MLDASFPLGRRVTPSIFRTLGATDKDGIIFGLLTAAITPTLGLDPGGRYVELARELGMSIYERIDGLFAQASIPPTATHKMPSQVPR